MSNHPAGRHRWTDRDTELARAAHDFDTAVDDALRVTATPPVAWPLEPEDIHARLREGRASSRALGYAMLVALLVAGFLVGVLVSL